MLLHVLKGPSLGYSTQPVMCSTWSILKPFVWFLTRQKGKESPFSPLGFVLQGPSDGAEQTGKYFSLSSSCLFILPPL